MRWGAVALLVLACAGEASAGSYVVSSCQAPGARGANNAWTPAATSWPPNPAQPTAYHFVQECQPGGRGLYVESTGPEEARFLTGGWYDFVAPPGTRITQLKVTRSGDKQRLSTDAAGDGWEIGGRDENHGVIGGGYGETCALLNAASCALPGESPGPYLLSTAKLSYGIGCVRAVGQTIYSCPVTANGVPAARVSVRSTEVTISDDSAPALTAGGSLFGDGWVPAGATAAVDASDNVGIKAVRLLIDGSERTAAPQACDFTRPLPCRNVRGAQLALGSAELADGAHTLSLVATDAAGNPAGIEKRVSIDFHAPAVAVALPRRGRIGASVLDGASGVAGVAVTARDDRGGAARTLRLTPLRHGRTSARYGSIPRAHLVLHVTASDRAGNAWEQDGRPSGISLGRARVGKRSRRVVHDRLRVPFGRSVTVRGRLADAGGRGLGGRTVSVTSTVRVAGAPREPVGGATTDARGRFAVRVPAGLSRVLRLTFDGGGGALRTVRALSLRVPATTTIRPSRRTVRGAGRVRFAGQVARHGQALPRGGVTVLLQGRQAGRWRTFKAAHTDRRGRWRTSYRFTGHSGRFAIRAYVSRSPAFPFDAGASRVVTVRVR